MKSKKYARRTIKGSMIAEAPLAIWLLLFMFTFPFLDLATATIRYTFLVAASRDAAHSAARAKTFLANASSTELSAVNIADGQAKLTAAAFSEVKVTTVTTRILITNLITKQVTARTTPLTQPADTGANLYQIETIVRGQINPLITYKINFLPGIPGISAPIAVSVPSRELCEYPEGLNI